MANPVNGPHLQVRLEQTGRTSNSAQVRATFTRINNYFWGAANMVSVRGPSNNHMYYWASPSKGTLWQWRGSYYGIYYGGRDQVLNANFHASGNAGGQAVNGYRWATSFSETFNVPINKGNSRTGSTTVRIGCVTQNAGSLNGNHFADLRVTTRTTAKPSNVKINITVDDKKVKDRKIHATLTFTNPDNYHTAYIEGVKGTTYSRPITKNDFKKQIPIRFTIAGKDGVVTNDQTVYSNVVEASGVGVWVKHNGEVKEVEEIYTKVEAINEEVEELWHRKGGQTIKTVK